MELIKMDVVLRIAELLVKFAPIAIQGIENAKPFAELLYKTLAKGDKITEADLDDLEAKITELSKELQTPLDPE